MNPKLLPALFLALFAGFLTGHAQSLVENGGFEAPVVPLGTLPILGTGLIPGLAIYAEVGSTPDTDLTDWSVDGTITQIDNHGTLLSDLGLLTPEEGNQYVVLNGLTATAFLGLGNVSVGAVGSLSQTLTTVAGTTYQVSFYYAGVNIAALAGSAELQVAVSNASNVTAPANGLLTLTANTGYADETFDFTATGTSSTLSFDEPTGSLVSADGVALDNVAVTPVPEPRQYAAAAMGFLVLLAGVRLWRRQPDEAVSPLVIS
jgi:hypothetical protein